MPFILSVDYDGTMFEDSYPIRGAIKKDVVDKVKEFKDAGAEIVLWTCREGNSLEEALERIENETDLEFDAINENAPSQLEYMKEGLKNGEIFATRKIFANFYLDDRAKNIDFFLAIDANATCDQFNNY